MSDIPHGLGMPDDKLRTAQEWLAIADFDSIAQGLYNGFVQRVGYDKADEVAGALRRICENLLDTLGALRMSEQTLLKLIRAVAAIAVDSYLPDERRRH